MKKSLLLFPLILSGCTTYQHLIDAIHTDTFHYQCDEKPLTVEINQQKQSASFVLDNTVLHLQQGLSASGARYTDGIYVFWSKGDKATVYRRDTVVLHNCQLVGNKD
ncbi:lysozyme inhibitor [Mangrovibacter phragmitis]|uniref:Lysozyme inhibitor n=1 Tax=Mangrovibacter phragmitis TaxID=1691903 RepID=A0A1B7L6T7_9ENTR|nr:MliC family protein [Mangrovibacter phragmitis]OAT78038.1 lysozyme inhibitor [Mangrovibacter phragmitis]